MLHPRAMLPSLLVCSVAAFSIGISRAESRHELANMKTAQEIVVLDPDRLPGFDLGTPGLVAAFLWLRTVTQIGSWYANRTLGDKQTQYLADQLDAIVRLDPYARMPALYASTLLTSFDNRVHDAHEIMLRSLAFQTGYWELYFGIGMLYYRHYGMLDRAAEWWKLAALQPNVLPGYLLNLSQFIQLRNTGAIDELAADFDKRTLPLPELRKEWDEIHAFRQMQQQLAYGIKTFERRFGRSPNAISEVVDAGIWPGYPIDPWGGRVELATDGKTILPSENIPIRPQERAVVAVDPRLDRGILRNPY